MKKIQLLFILLFLPCVFYSQLVTSNPVFFSEETGNLEVIFDASLGNGGLKGYTGEVYAHTGVITNASTGDSDWKHAPVWGDNSAKYRMTSLGNNKWKLLISPNVKEYYSLNANERAVRLAFVFRSKDNSREAKTEAGADIFLDVTGEGLHARFTEPENNAFFTLNAAVNIQFVSSETADLSLIVNNEEKKTITGANLQYSYTFSQSGNYELVAKAEKQGTSAYDTINVFIPANVTNETKPATLKDGINYIDNTTVGLVLYAPGKENVFVLGDFNDWKFSNQYQMKRDGNRWWITIDNLDPQTLYAFQYAVDNGNLYVSDAYTELVLDPWNDKYISSAIFPNLKSYPTGKADGLVSTFRIEKPQYQWEVPDFSMPDPENLVIYEMLIRDFTSQKSLKAAMEKLDYLETLGITAIELMPVQEFDGNLSWGYNPNHFFAPDKAYGTPDMYKKFIDECHKRGMAVILDMVFNHATGINPFAKLYWNGAANKTAADNPWFNIDAPHPYSVFHDFNHEFAGTREYFKEVLQYWIKEYKIDGYRMDLTKGFTQKVTVERKPNGDETDRGAANYDATRIAILKDYYHAAKEANPGIMFILEHFCDNREEKELAEEGMYLWRNMNNAFSQAAMGYPSESAFSGLNTTPRRWVGYAESHDEERNFYKAKTWGSGIVKTNEAVRLSRIPANIAFIALTPGPKMIWQFGEMGYDYSIEHNGRTGEKPPVWEWLEKPDRKRAYVHSAKALNLRKQFPQAFSEGNFKFNINTTDWNSGRRIELKHQSLNMVAIANFKPEEHIEVPLNLPKAGIWHDLITGAELNMENTDRIMKIEAGKVHIFTDRKIHLPDELNEIESSLEFVDEGSEIPFISTFVTDKLRIITKSEIKEVIIYNMQSKTIRKDTSGKAEIDINDLSPGIYIVEVQTNQGRSYEKIVKSSR